MIQKIPTRIKLSGNISRASLIADSLGKHRLQELQHNLSFNNLPTGSNSIVLQGGIEVRTTVNYGITNIYVYVPSTGRNQKKKVPICFCSPCFANAYIIDIHESVDPLYGKNTYDMLVCQKTIYYAVKGFNIFSASYDDYSIGQQVVLGMMDEYNFSANCCGYDATLSMCEMNIILHDLHATFMIYPIDSAIAEWESTDEPS